MMVRYVAVIMALMVAVFSQAQGFNEDKNALANFLKRMYESAPFDGVKVVEDYDRQYFISVVALEDDKYPSSSARDRVAQVKARQQANAYFNGSSITSQIEVITTEARGGGGTEVKIIDRINEQSLGFVEGLELLSGFKHQPDRSVYIFYRALSNP